VNATRLLTEAFADVAILLCAYVRLHGAGCESRVGTGAAGAEALAAQVNQMCRSAVRLGCARYLVRLQLAAVFYSAQEKERKDARLPSGKDTECEPFHNVG
jgi:hypothetical protein